MQISKLGLVLILALILFVAFRCSQTAEAAGNGKQTFETLCADCHEAIDFEDTTKAEIEAVATGKVKHKKALTLTQSQIQDIVQYLTTK